MLPHGCGPVVLSNLNVAGSKQYFHANKTDFLGHLMILELTHVVAIKRNQVNA